MQGTERWHGWIITMTKVRMLIITISLIVIGGLVFLFLHLNTFQLFLASILIVAISAMLLQWWIDRGAKHMPKHLHAFLTKKIE